MSRLEEPCYSSFMATGEKFDHFLIRDSSILVRVLRKARQAGDVREAELYDVRTGVQVREIYPSLDVQELLRAHPISAASAQVIMKSGAPAGADPAVDLSKVINILEIKQRRLDSVVADSVLDQLRVIIGLLQEYVEAAESAQPEEKLWLSQQLLSVLQKFSGRELAELREIVDWFNSRPKKP
ncbi:MAG: hypothetical protein AB1473_23730 [Thermodesulfobacteriota bacterium]